MRVLVAGVVSWLFAAAAAAGWLGGDEPMWQKFLFTLIGIPVVLALIYGLACLWLWALP